MERCLGLRRGQELLDPASCRMQSIALQTTQETWQSKGKLSESDVSFVVIFQLFLNPSNYAWRRHSSRSKVCYSASVKDNSCILCGFVPEFLFNSKGGKKGPQGANSWGFLPVEIDKCIGL